MAEDLINIFTPENIEAAKNLYDIVKDFSKVLKEPTSEIERNKEGETIVNHQKFNTFFNTISNYKISVTEYMSGLINHPTNLPIYDKESYDQFYEMYYSVLFSIKPNSKLHQAVEDIRSLFEEYNEICRSYSRSVSSKPRKIKKQLNEFKFRFEYVSYNFHVSVYHVL
ncbi:hypothetical protein D770_25410 [Flammeovirgaceae bacterium 311]|nr:hypothetical protein D770_25410 [Flammeovirgaceae bacterium 311]